MAEITSYFERLILSILMVMGLAFTACEGLTIDPEGKQQQAEGSEDGGAEGEGSDVGDQIDSTSRTIDYFALTDGIQIFEPFDTTSRTFSFILPLKCSELKSLKTISQIKGEYLTLNGIRQIEGETENDLSNFIRTNILRVFSYQGTFSGYKVVLYNLPIIYAETPQHADITSKDVWTVGCNLAIRYTDGSITDLGSVSLRGRGNTTWLKPKKPYAVLLDSPSRLLGMGKGKRWDLLANYCDRTCMRNALAMHVGELCEGLEWTPKGRFVELFFNGTFQGQYYLMEHIKLGKERIDIDEMSPADTTGDALTGGYLLELDHRQEDDTYAFRSIHRTAMMYYFKSPDSDEVIPDAQVQYMKDYVLSFESSIADRSAMKAQKSVWRDFVDVESYADYWLAFEFCYNKEASNGPYSVFQYKKRYVPGDPLRDGKMYAGPLWDFDRSFNVIHDSWRAKSAVYYNHLFLDPSFVKDVKSRWILLKSALEDPENGMTPFFDRLLDMTLSSTQRDNNLWPRTADINGDESMSLTEANAALRRFFPERIEWLDTAISGL